MALTKKSKVIASGMSPNLQKAFDSEWTATERSDDAEAAVLREYHYHLLRCEELKIFLKNCGFSVDGD
jgi:hypothetical protein